MMVDPQPGLADRAPVGGADVPAARRVDPAAPFPLLLMAVNSNGLRAATHLPGFPTHFFLAFFMPFAFIQGALFASAIAGTDLARDIDTGFLNRLALTPVRGSALLIGQIGGAVGLGALQACRLPRRRRSSPACTSTRASAARSLLLVIAVLIAMGWGTLGLWIALRTGSGEGVQSQFPLLFFVHVHLEHQPAAQPDRGRRGSATPPRPTR